MTPKIVNSLILFITLLGAAHAFADDARVVFDAKVKISELSKNGLSKDELVESGKEAKLKSNTIYWISSYGRVPLLVVPQAPEQGETATKLILPDVTNWPSEVSAQQLQSKMALIIDDLYQFQTALARKDITEAEKALSRMEAVQPMDYYYFLQASLAFVKGDMKAAKEQVQKGLKKYPSNEQGVRLLKTIEGNSK